MKAWLAVLAAALLSGLLVVACGEDDDGDTNQDGNDDDAALLEQMVLSADELAPGLEQASTALSTNEDLAGAAVNPEGELDRLELLGRKLGYEVQYAPGQDAPTGLRLQAQISVSLFEAASGASQSLADGLAKARTTDWAAANSDLTDVRVLEPPAPADVDEGGWFRIVGNDSGGNVIIDDEVAFRVENVRAFLRAVLLLPPGTSEDAYQEQTEGWVTLEAQRIRDVLSGALAASPAN